MAHLVTIIVIPGFLTEEPTVPHGLHDANLPGALGDWLRAMQLAKRSHPAPTLLLHWPSTPAPALLPHAGWLLSGAMATTLIAGAFGVSSAQRAWMRARDSVVPAAEALVAACASLSDEVVLVGHSLGGRLALEAAARWQGPPLHVCALAPAVGEHELDWEAIASRTTRKPDVVWSRADLVLDLPFRLGELAAHGALGRDGPKGPAVGRVNSVDATEMPYGERVGHLAYSEILDLLLPMCPGWKEATRRAVTLPPPTMHPIGNAPEVCPRCGQRTRHASTGRCWKCAGTPHPP